jgi:hypothetical protein
MCRFLCLLFLGGLAYAQLASSSAPSAAIEPNSRAVSTNNSDDVASLLPDLPPMPKGKASLLGGTVRNLDRVRDRIVLHVFGGHNMVLLFDGRTRVYRDGAIASVDSLASGERVSVDTVLDGKDVFARNIRILTHSPDGQSSGQVLNYDASRQELSLRDALSPEPIKLHMTASTVVLRGDHAASLSDLRPGALVAVKFVPSSDGRDIAHEVSILALPGAEFGFAGRVATLDLSAGLLVVVDPRDKKSYEIRFDPTNVRVVGDLQEGVDVTVTASFDGIRYTAETIAVNRTPAK